MPHLSLRAALTAALGLRSTLVNRGDVSSYVANEAPRAKAGLLANIGADGSLSSGASPGVVIASPSTSNPNYLYSWTRDSALVFKVIVDQYTLGIDETLGNHITDYITATNNIQQITNPSGTVSTGGLGEPKFYINETAFEGPWGRPQRDGPALRATTLITYSNWLIANNQANQASAIWPSIKLDLDYVQDNWNKTTFDLWEEINSSSFWTTAVQHRALRQGAALANALGQDSSIASGYTTQADNTLCFLQSYWNPDKGYVTSNTDTSQRSGIDANSVLTSIHTFDPDAGCDSTTFQPCSDKALSNLKVYVDSFRGIYGLNNGVAAPNPVSVGRYPEDVYMGGNPWYLTMFAVVEQVYDAVYVWAKQGRVDVTDLSLPFFQQFKSDITSGSYPSGSDEYNILLSAIEEWAEEFIGINAYHTPTDGSLSEQFDKNTGYAISAVDLTWSYASALTAFMSRNRTQTVSWGAQGLQVPSVCLCNN